MCAYVLSNAPPCPEMADRDSDIMVDVLMSWVALDVVVSEKWSLNRFVALHVRSGYHPQTDHGPAGDSA